MNAFHTCSGGSSNTWRLIKTNSNELSSFDSELLLQVNSDAGSWGLIVAAPVVGWKLVLVFGGPWQQATGAVSWIDNDDRD